MEGLILSEVLLKKVKEDEEYTAILGYKKLRGQPDYMRLCPALLKEREESYLSDKLYKSHIYHRC